MPSQAEAAAARVAAVLVSVTGATGGVFRDRSEAFSREEGACILVELVSDDSTPFSGGRSTDQAEWRIAIIYLTRAAAWQTVVDDMRVQGHSLVIADATLASLIGGLHRTRAEWHAASADLPLGYCAQQYSGKYLSPTSALSRLS